MQSVTGKRNTARLIIQFALDDLEGRYAGSLGGTAWAFLQPLTTILIYWFIFQVGFKSQPVDGCPFILWLLSGLLPWFFVGEALQGATSSLADYGYLVKKIVFKVEILPLVRVVASSIVQLFLLVIALIVFAIFGRFPYGAVFYLVIPFAYMILLVSGIGYITSAFFVFFKDLVQIIGIILQAVFWLTPIVWDFNIMPEAVRRVLTFNPLYYVVTGYRAALIGKEPPPVGLPMTVYYWVIALLFLFIGRKVFMRMKGHFADVL